MSRLTSVFASTDAPLVVNGIIVSAISGLLAAGLCSLVDPRVVPVGLVIGAILGFVAASAPMFMALRLIAVAGLMLVGSAVLGTMVQHTSIVAALVMACLALITSVWTAVPVVGTIFSSLPTLVFILLLAKGDEFAKGAPALVVAAAGLLAMLPPVLLAVAISARDPRKYDRAMTAALWRPDTPADKRGTFARVLLLDGAPSPLLFLAAHGSLGLVCRSWLQRDGQRSEDPPPAATAAEAPAPDAPAAAGLSDGLAQGDANAEAIAAALLPKGPLLPRDVSIDTDAMSPRPSAGSGGTPGPATPAREEAAAWSLWAASQQRARSVLAADAAPEPVVLRPLLIILGSLIRCLLQPEVSVFRYGVQRALVLGAGAFAVVQSGGQESFFWILITMSAVLQANAPSTAMKVARRSVGTFVGVLAAVALSFLLPSWLLVPWLAGTAMVMGFAWMQRNYTLTALLSGFAVVLLYGAPTDDVVPYAILRAVDVVIGGVLAALVARFVMPVKPRLAARRRYLVESLRGLEHALRQRLADPTAVPVTRLAAYQSEVSRAMSDLRTDLALTTDADVVRAYQDDLAGFVADDEKLFVLGMTVVDLARDSGVADLPVAAALDWLRHDIDTRADRSPTARAATAAG